LVDKGLVLAIHVGDFELSVFDSQATMDPGRVFVIDLDEVADSPTKRDGAIADMVGVAFDFSGDADEPVPLLFADA
jgi:hypothetical protein